MSFLEQLWNRLPRTGLPVRGVWIGPYWTAVQTNNGTGLATTLLGDGHTHGEHAQRFAAAGRLTQLSAHELAEGVLSEFPLERSVGMAALNALLPEPEGSITERNAGELAAEKGTGKTIGVVGWFPFIPQLKKVATVEVFEKDPETGYDLTEERAARMARCDGLCITASALINGTIDGILEAAPASAWKLLVGPSAPLCCETLELGFDAVCGARVGDPEAILPVLQQGGCFQQIKRTGAVRLLNLEA